MEQQDVFIKEEFIVQNQKITQDLTVSCVMVDTLPQNDLFCSELLTVEGAVSVNSG